MRHVRKWALAAVAMAAAVACTKAPEGPDKPTEAQNEPALQSVPGETPWATPAPAPTAAEPGYAGEWAFELADCPKPTSTFKLSATEINMTPGERACKVSSIDEQHPTGRSAIYTVKASCLTEGETSEDTFKLEFGASDTVMRLQLNEREPITLERCPAS